MSTYNRLIADVTCPRCGSTREAEVDCYFGNTSMMESYCIGDIYDWPMTTDAVGEAYCECPECKRDFFAAVHIASGRIKKVEADTRQAPYIPDHRLYEVQLACPVCQTISATEVHLYEGYRIGRILPGCDCHREAYVALQEEYHKDNQVELEPASPTYLSKVNVERDT